MKQKKKIFLKNVSEGEVNCVDDLIFSSNKYPRNIDRPTCSIASRVSQTFSNDRGDSLAFLKCEKYTCIYNVYRSKDFYNLPSVLVL